MKKTILATLMLLLSHSAMAGQVDNCKLNINFKRYPVVTEVYEEQRGTNQQTLAVGYKLIPQGLENFEYNILFYENVTGNEAHNWFVGRIKSNYPYEILIIKKDAAPNNIFAYTDSLVMRTRLPGVHGRSFRGEVIGDYDISIICLDR